MRLRDLRISFRGKGENVSLGGVRGHNNVYNAMSELCNFRGDDIFRGR